MTIVPAQYKLPYQTGDKVAGGGHTPETIGLRKSSSSLSMKHVKRWHRTVEDLDGTSYII